jgi:hypothetical protein
MARYDTFIYNTGVKYGQTSAVVYDVGPFVARAIDYDKIIVSWVWPNYNLTQYSTRFRLVRNQYNPSETQEDGVILVDNIVPANTSFSSFGEPSFVDGHLSTSGTITNIVADGTTVTFTAANSLSAGDTVTVKELSGTAAVWNLSNAIVIARTGTTFSVSSSVTGTFQASPHSYALGTSPKPQLIPGKYVYYSIWLLKNDGGNIFWDKVNDTTVLLAKDHSSYLGTDAVKGLTKTRSTHDKLMDLFPKVFTSLSENALDVVDKESDLYLFLLAFSYTLDEFYTYIDLLLPQYTQENLSPQLVEAKAYELAVSPDSQKSVAAQRRLVRDARHIIANKSTLIGVHDLVEAMTGYGNTITVSSNLMLTNQDSTFRGGLGSWQTIGGCTLAVEQINPTPTQASFATDLALAADLIYSAKLVVSTVGARIVNGSFAPVTQGIPVTAGLQYTLSFYQQSSATATFGKFIKWFDVYGNLLSTSNGSSSSVTSSWSKLSYTATAPSNAAYASIELVPSATGTYYLDMFSFTQSASGGAFEEARGVKIDLIPSKKNYITNPSFEANKSGWTITDSGATTPSDVPNGLISGSKSLLATISPTSSISTTYTLGANDVAGSYYTFSLYSKSATNFPVNVSLTAVATGSITGASSVAATGGGYFITYLTTFNANIGDLITVSGLGGSNWNQSTAVAVVSSTSSSVTVKVLGSAPSGSPGTGTMTLTQVATTPVTLTNSWSRYQTTVYVPSNYSGATLTAQVVGTGTSGSVAFDAAQLERAYSATDYFDGSMTIAGALWTGTANASVSYLYPNKGSRINRLQIELANYLAMNTPYLVTINNQLVTGSSGPFIGFA